MRHYFIINPAAGTRDSTEQLLDQIKKLDFDYELAMTGSAGDAERLTRRAVERGEPIRIYACGGDGTLNEVVNGAAGAAHAAITNVAKGTGNDFLKIFGEGWREGFTDLKALSEGPQAAFDLIDCNGKLGLGVACAGVDSRVANDVHRYKTMPVLGGKGAYVTALVDNVLFKGISRPMKVRMGDGFSYDGEVTLICACNGRYYGGGFMPVGEAMPDDGVLDFLMVRGIGRIAFARMVKKYSTGRYRECSQYVHDWHGDQITFSSDEEIVAVVDGELIRDHEFTIRLSEKKINFFWPEYLNYQIKQNPCDK